MSELLRVENLTKEFPAAEFGKNRSTVKAVENVSFSIEKGTTFGLVGESGSGKTTTGRTLLRLTRPTSGKIFYEGVDITHVNMKPYRKKMQIVFQNPGGSLDSKYRVGDVIAEGIRANKLASSKADEQALVAKLLSDVGLHPEDMFRYPNEFSGGQQQRIGIARALAVDPQFIVCDEPVSALDVSYQAQIVNMLMELQQQKHLTYLFISHDLSVVRHMSDQIAIMYFGKIVEMGPCEEIIDHPAHPYTVNLLNSIPVADPKIAKARQRKEIIFEEKFSGNGCRFYSRCPRATEQCKNMAPQLREIAPGHQAACHLV